MQQQNYLEILNEYTENFLQDYIEEIQVNTMDLLENTNPGLSKESKSYKESDKHIFKQHISYENAQRLVLAITNTSDYKENNLYEYKENIRTICNLTLAINESPVEMMVYATKKIANEDPMYINSVLDILKFLQYKDKNFELAYRNILTHWTWIECLNVVLKSISDLRISSLGSEIYALFEKNQILSKACALTLIELGEEKYFESILNFIVTNDNETTKQIDDIREISIFMARRSPNGSQCIYKIYMNVNMRNVIANNLIAGIRKNLTKEILDDLSNSCKQPNNPSYIYSKIVNLLRRCDKFEPAVRLLNDIKPYLPSNIVILDNDIDNLKKVAQDRTSDKRTRTDAIIRLGKSDAEGVEDLLREIYNESEIMKIIVGSVLVEKGNMKELVNHFKSLISENEDLSQEASGQIRRLRALNNSEINKTLITIANTLLQSPNSVKDVTQIIKILDLYSTGLPDEKVGKMFFDKLKQTDHTDIQKKIYDFLLKNSNRFIESFQKEIKSQLVEDSKKNTDAAGYAMECLMKINKGQDAVPTMGGRL